MSHPQGGPYGPPQGSAAGLDLKKIMPGGLIAVVGSLLYFVFSFFAWYTLNICEGMGLGDDFPCTATRNAWDRGPALISVLLFLLVAAIFVVSALQVIPPRVPLGLFALGAVLLADIFFLVSLISVPWPWSRGWGLWVSLVLAIVITVGAVLQFISAGGIASVQRGFGSAQGSQPPPGYGPPGGYPQQGNPPQQPQQPPGHPPQGPA
ncbi:MAG TPA: hypothetical protein VFB19_14900 [Mycobacterium sp.]|nr:hypothetical protein [Mycobacterium sp.]